MGMDVFGLKPTTEQGKYFRNSVWWWRPLWNYCIELAPDIISDQLAEDGHCNGGAGLDSDKAAELGLKLLSELLNGNTLQYQSEYNFILADLPRQTCTICTGTGIREDAIGIDAGWPLKELSPEVQILTGRTHGSCNSCNGIGTTENWSSSYPFSVENVSNFSTFCIDSGGFEIW